MVSLPFTIPSNYSIEVKKGDSVKVGQLLAKKIASPEARISLSEAFSLPAHSVGKYLRVKIGDGIEVGDVLAVKKSLFREDQVISEVAGTIIGFERDTGEVIIRQQRALDEQRAADIISPIDGKVTVCNNGQIVLDTDKDVMAGEKGVGGKSEAEVYTPPSNVGSETSLLFALDTKAIGKILLARSIDRDVLLKAIGMGVEGIICSDIQDGDLEYLKKRNITTPVVMLSGDTFKKTTKWLGKRVYLDGSGKTILLLHS